MGLRHVTRTICCHPFDRKVPHGAYPQLQAFTPGSCSSQQAVSLSVCLCKGHTAVLCMHTQYAMHAVIDDMQRPVLATCTSKCVYLQRVLLLDSLNVMCCNRVHK